MANAVRSEEGPRPSIFTGRGNTASSPFVMADRHSRGRRRATPRPKRSSATFYRDEFAAKPPPSWRAKARHPRLAVRVASQAWMPTVVRMTRRHSRSAGLDGGANSALRDSAPRSANSAMKIEPRSLVLHSRRLRMRIGFLRFDRDNVAQALQPPLEVGSRPGLVHLVEVSVAEFAIARPLASI